MLQKKVCVLGAFGVGKTTLVRRFVESIFSDAYLTTVGVKIDKKPMVVDGQDVTLMLWDLYGQDDYQTIQDSHLRGTAGYLLVVDGTRPSTLDTARDLQPRLRQIVGDVPFVVVLNKADLAGEWRIDDAAVSAALPPHSTVVRASAKTGDGVEAAFAALTRSLLAR